MPIYWSDDLDTGIEVIDTQHRQIVEFINRLEAAQVVKDSGKTRQVVDACYDYTLSHFAFEESLLDEAGYVHSKPHKRMHKLFSRKIGEYQQRLEEGHDVAEELHDMLARWLLTHIRRDDADYVGTVKANMIQAIAVHEEKRETRGWLSRFFR